MSEHALLSPSSAHRWLNCLPSPRLEATLPERSSRDADEGTLAHSVCEISAKKKFKKVKAAEYNRVIKQLKKDELWDDEMLRTAETYADHLAERSMSFESEPYVAFEVKVDLASYVPESFGRCDCVMFGGGTLVITDYKHGKGVPVDVERNPQLMLYALGALKVYQPLFGEAIKRIELYVDQPRLSSYQGWSCTVEELLAWGEEIRPKAQMAFAGFGEYKAGSWCRFCRANGTCKAQAAQQIGAFDDFAAVVNQSADLLTPEQMAEVLKRGETLVEWYKTVKAKALDSILSGTPIPGYKAVEGRSVRAWSDQDKALEKLIASGIDRAAIYDSVPKTLAQIEKLLGKPKFGELVGEFVIKPPGAPTLADEGDPKPAYNSAAADFAAVADKKEGKET